MSSSNINQPMALPPIDLRQLTEILIRHHGLNSGRYQIALGFRLGVGPLPGPPGAEAIPGAMVGVENVGLVQVPNEVNNPDVVDAALVNPAPQKKTRQAKSR